ncbi:MAG: photosystem I reaction center protein subunit XI [Hormoscilla sp. GUM202]|nr:photosystem I reaction center protein subunit XI [Hormoscilla sp. GUM202]
MADTEVIKPYNDDPFVGHLSTPISDSDFTKAFISNLPAYRTGLSPLLRGLEVGMAHGYFLYGPFAVLGPLRDSDLSTAAGLLATVGMVMILTIALSIHGAADAPKPPVTAGVPNPPAELWSKLGWSEFAGGFFLGGCGGAFFAYILCLTPHLAPLQKIVSSVWSS